MAFRCNQTKEDSCNKTSRLSAKYISFLKFFPSHGINKLLSSMASLINSSVTKTEGQIFLYIFLKYFFS